MTKRAATLVLLLVGAAAILSIAIGHQRVRAAEAELAAARSSAAQTERDLQTIVNLRAQAPTVEMRQRPTQDVIAQVNAALAEVGIPASHLQSLAPEGESNGAAHAGGTGGRLREQSIRLTLRALSPAQLGTFLMHWHGQQEVWSANRLEMVHNRESPDGNLYDATIVITAMYVAGSVDASSSPSGSASPATERP